MSIDDAVKRLRGPKGTPVRITIVRQGYEAPLEFTVIRDSIPLHSVPYFFMASRSVGYLRLTDFNETTACRPGEGEGCERELEKALKSLQKTLAMEEPLRCIECIDIAHLKGGETVGSKVCFIDGRPFKAEYRRYRIRSVEGGNDDYASIREVVSRRYREAGSGQELYPDLIIIDGGLGQLHAALEAFQQLDVKPPMVISLAKKEELIFVQERTEPIRLGRENPGLRLCQALRDEAHRFAQHYHHILRRKKTLEED